MTISLKDLASYMLTVDPDRSFSSYYRGDQLCFVRGCYRASNAKITIPAHQLHLERVYVLCPRHFSELGKIRRALRDAQ